MCLLRTQIPHRMLDHYGPPLLPLTSQKKKNKMKNKMKMKM